MIIERKKEFSSVTQRVLYGFKFVYSGFVPVISDHTNENCQRKLHELMGQMIDRLYDTPDLLNLPNHPDEAYEWDISSNQKPALSAAYLLIYKTLYEFYKFLYISALYGEMDGGRLSIGNAVLKEHKAEYKACYSKLLGEVAIETVKDKNNTVFNMNEDLLKALRLLAEKIPVSSDPYYPYALVDFVRCSFGGDNDYLLTRFDSVNKMDGLLLELKNQCLKRGYEQELRFMFTGTDLTCEVQFKSEVGGFQIGYNSRKYRQFYFGTLNGIGEKAMLENFDNLDDDMKQHFINICKPCNGCLICTKNGKNKAFTVNVNFNVKDYKLCPSFPRHSWETYNVELIDVLFKYHDLQLKYQSPK